MSFIRAKTSQILVSLMIVIAGSLSVINATSFESIVVIFALMIASLLTLRMLGRLAALMQRNASNIQELRLLQQGIGRKLSESTTQLKSCDDNSRRLLDLALSSDSRTRRIFELSTKEEIFQTQYIDLSRQLHFTLGEGFSKLSDALDSKLVKNSLKEQND